MSDYTPDEEELASAYAGDMSTWAHENYDAAEAGD